MSTTTAITKAKATKAPTTPPAIAVTLELPELSDSDTEPEELLSIQFLKSASSFWPSGQPQVKVPSILTHVSEQPPFSSAHSSMSLHFSRSSANTYPLLQEQTGTPVARLHSCSQLLVTSQGSDALQVLPSLSNSKPSMQSHEKPGSSLIHN